jgi:hypothetical protein
MALIAYTKSVAPKDKCSNNSVVLDSSSSIKITITERILRLKSLLSDAVSLYVTLCLGTVPASMAAAEDGAMVLLSDYPLLVEP